MANKGIKRLAFFVIFLIPVGWYLFLQLFGSNKFALEAAIPFSQTCGKLDGITVLYRGDSVQADQINYLNRVTYKVRSREVKFLYNQGDFIDCIVTKEADLVLASREGTWGSYMLDREGVDQLMTELDILIMQNSYGEGISR